MHHLQHGRRGRVALGAFGAWRWGSDAGMEGRGDEGESPRRGPAGRCPIEAGLTSYGAFGAFPSARMQNAELRMQKGGGRRLSPGRVRGMGAVGMGGVHLSNSNLGAPYERVAGAARRKKNAPSIYRVVLGEGRGGKPRF